MLYKEMYLLLFDACAKAIELLQNAHQQSEELYIQHENNHLSILQPNNDKEL